MSAPTPVAFLVPTDWSDEQAYAVWESLSELVEALWQQYQAPILQRLAHEHGTLYAEPDLDQLDLFDPDDDIPF